MTLRFSSYFYEFFLCKYFCICLGPEFQFCAIGLTFFESTNKYCIHFCVCPFKRSGDALVKIAPLKYFTFIDFHLRLNLL